MGFGGVENQKTVEDYLPFKIVDPNSPSERLKQNIGQETIAIFKELVRTNQIPPHIVRDFYSIEEFYLLVQEKDIAS